ncbi:MAG: glycosyltransferase family 4 protein [Bacteroidales bacterium]|nr:glycosyltransferase family 4 protein [Bacteroidales bacterium]
MKYLYVTTISMTLDYFLKGVMTDLIKAGNEVVAVSSPGPWMAGVRAIDGVKVIEVPMERRISPLKDLRSLCRLYKVIRAERPDIVHSFTPKAGLLAMMTAKLAGIKVRVHTFTGLVFPTASGLKKRLLKTTDKLTCSCATNIIAEGQGVRKDLIDAGITKKEVRVLGHGNIRGIDLTYYDRTPEVMELAEKLRVPDVFTFLFVGRVVRDKGIVELVQAFERLCSDKRSVRLVLVGPFENNVDPVPEDIRRRIGENPDIITAGELTGIDLLAWYAASDCFVLPSYREGFPNTVIEAGAMGLPSIVTDINGSNEIISDSVNGLIVPPKDSEALFNAMRKMLDDNIFRESSSVCREMIASRFEQGYVRGCLYSFYDFFC